MVKAVKGFQADDGSFFPTEPDAEHHEARLELTDACVEARISPDKLLTFINTNLSQVDRYVKATLNLSASTFDGTVNGDDQEDIEGRKKDDDGLLEQPSGKR